MKMIIKQKVYLMNRKQYRKTLKIAGRCVKNGIYAIEKDEIGELMNETLEQPMNLKQRLETTRKQDLRYTVKECD